MDEKSLDFWIKNELNVLMIGGHGVGKTARIKEAFERNNLKWRYFSASTLDPWVDFIGVPKEVEDPVTKVRYLDLVRPRAFAEDDVEAIFMDEYNRAPKKVRNAVMELIQFKSINGKVFKNLKMVWAAVNPDDDEEDNKDDNVAAYDVEKLDPAQEDRFQIVVRLPDEPDRGFFSKNYGEQGENAVDWWEGLDKKVRKNISPRRLEYVLKMHISGGDIRQILFRAKGANVTKLLQELANGSYRKNLYKVFNSGDDAEAAKFIKNPNNYDNCIDEIVKSSNMLKLFFKHIDDEKLNALSVKYPSVMQFINDELKNYEPEVTEALQGNPLMAQTVKKKQDDIPILNDF